MNTTRREELAALAIAGELTDTERAELATALGADPAFAREVEALHETDAQLTALARPLVQHPQLVLGEGAQKNIRRAAAARTRTPWWTLPKIWLGTGLAAAACVALAVIVVSSRRGSPERGAALVAQLHTQADITRIGVWATKEQDRTVVKACLWVDAAAWEKLPRADRTALLAHLRAQIPAIRANPAAYAASAGGGQPAADVARALPALRADDVLVMTMVRTGSGWERRGFAPQPG